MSQGGLINSTGGGGPGSPIATLTGNSGGPVSPTANNINTVGTGSITVVGNPGTSTLTAQLTGLTNHSLLVGAGTATITNLGVASNGQLPIGSAGLDPVLATLTAGTGIAIVNGAGSITISATSSGMAWSDKSTDFTAVAENGYFIAGSCIATMPAAPANGDTIQFFVDGAFTVTVTANAGQTLKVSTVTSAVAGTAANIASGDAITFVYRSTNTRWEAVTVVGSWTVT